MTIDPDDIGHNDTPNPRFEDVLDARLARRSVLRGGVGGAVAALFGGGALSACGGAAVEAREPPLAAKVAAPVTALGFAPVAKGLADVVSVPEGYTATVLYALGDPLDTATPAYANDGTDGAFEHRAGDHHDGIEFFGLGPNGRTRNPNAVDRGLLAVNHEAMTQQFLHPTGATPNGAERRPAAEIDKEVAAHGVSVVEIRRRGKTWSCERDSSFNRRITPLSPIEIAGPARGSALVVTKHDPSALTTRGTLNNCGTGSTPWGTLLTGEENWAGYFTRNAADDAARGDKSVAALNRYGRRQGAGSRHAWEKSDAPADQYRRWDVSRVGTSADGSDDYRNELNGQGYITEIDPYDPAAPIRKRTALGRFAHESAAFGKLVDGLPLAVYMGDDSQNEYCYKFVSALPWSNADANASERIAMGDKYLNQGKLYVARFDPDGTGRWIELSMDNPAVRGYAGYAFENLADVVVNARLAADAVGATKMDRPEWCGTHPATGEVYFTLTNNASRAPALTDAANPRSYTDPFDGVPRASVRNWNGHIVRLAEDGGRADATSFRWDVYLFGAEAGADPDLVNLSSLTADQDFSSPDGLVFSRATGICWIQTDDGAYTDITNCMMLAALPGSVGDGAAKTLVHTLPDGSTREVTTRAGRTPTAATLKRFLVGPVDCEITGCAETADGRALFVNIQHPGESIRAADIGEPSKYLSHWPGNAGYGPGGANARPRSATIVITKDDGGRIGT